eukprot:3570680-Alexandrium_andersonii.AAC.1
MQTARPHGRPVSPGHGAGPRAVGRGALSDVPRPWRAVHLLDLRRHAQGETEGGRSAELLPGVRSAGCPG